MNGKIIRLFTVCGAFAVFFLSSCGKPDVLLLADHYLYESGYFTKERIREIEGEVWERGKTMELSIVERNGGTSERVIRAVSESGAEIVVTTPVLGEAAETARREFPREVRLVRLEHGLGGGDGDGGSGSGSTGGDTAGRIGFSRVEAFSALGGQLGAVLSGIEYSDDEDVGAVGMWHIGTERRKEEYDAFMESFSAVCSPERLEIERVNTVPDSSAVRTYLEEVRKKGVVFGIAFVSYQNSELITSYRGLGFGIVSEYLFPVVQLPVSTPLLSIEYPFAEAVSAAVELAESDGNRAIVHAELRKKNLPGQK